MLSPHPRCRARSRSRSALVVLLAAAASGAGVPAQASLVRDLNPTVATVLSSSPTGYANPLLPAQHHENGPGGTFVSSFVRLGNAWYFAARTVAHGMELWRTDGTTAGTALVKDVRPGPQDGNPVLLANCNGRLFFGADDGVHGPEPWTSDGTTAGT